MIVRLSARGIRHVLVDIEGTTTPLAFVHQVLFPYAQAHLQEWMAATAGSPIRADIEHRLALEHEALVREGARVPPWSDSTERERTTSFTAFVGWLMAADVKSPALKELQGQIWERGYQAGELRGDVYPDVPVAMRRWRDDGIEIAIYSSGSELAQRRLFASTVYGDLTPLITAFFDTSVGTKKEASSYVSIAERLGVRPSEVLFVSDVSAELDAARSAGMLTALASRPGNAPVHGSDHDRIRSLADLL